MGDDTITVDEVKKKLGRPKGSKNKKKTEPSASGESSTPEDPPAKTFAKAFTGMSFGQSVKDSQEIFQIRLIKPDVIIRNKDVLDYFKVTRHGRSLFGLQRHEKDLIATFHSKEAREEFLDKKILKMGNAEVHVAPFPYEKPALKGAKFIMSGVRMEATSSAVQKALHPFAVDRFMFERYEGSHVRTDRVIFWTTEKVPSTLYVLGSKVQVRQVGMPSAPANSPASRPAAEPKEKEKDPQTPTRQAQKTASNLAEGATPKRKDISPLANPPKQAKTRLDAEAPAITVELLKELNLPIPTQHTVLSIYEDVTEETALVQHKEIPSPLGKKKVKVIKEHDLQAGTQDWFVLSLPDSDSDSTTPFKYEGSYVNETSDRYYAGMRWVQRLVHEGVITVVIFKSRIYRNRQATWH